MAGGIRTPLALVGLLAAIGCGGDSGGGSRATTERTDPPARAPHGWRTVRNRTAGFTLSVPRSWTARVKSSATLIRSKDRLLVLTLAADRGADGRQLSAAEYARRTLNALPDFEGSVLHRARSVRGSPYRSARVDGEGTLRTTKRPERITVVTYRRPRQVTYALVAFSNAKVRRGYFEPRLRRILRSFRAQPPRGS